MHSGSSKSSSGIQESPEEVNPISRENNARAESKLCRNREDATGKVVDANHHNKRHSTFRQSSRSSVLGSNRPSTEIKLNRLQLLKKLKQFFHQRITASILMKRARPLERNKMEF
jgi:hypothetical protein